MADLLILAFLIVTPGWLISHWVRARPQLERKERSVDPLTGALYFGTRTAAREGTGGRGDS